MRLKLFALAVVLFSLATVRAQESSPAPPVEVAPQVTPLPVVTPPRWLQRPNGAQFNQHYPPRARAEGVDGVATLDCLVGVDGLLACTVLSEEPEGWGFGEAALQLARYFRMVPQLVDGVPTAGGRYRMRIPFRFADN